MKTKPLEQRIEDILAYYESDGSNITMPKTVEAISNLVEEARIDELDRARTNTRPSILYGTNIKYSAVADSYLIDRLSDLKSNRE